MGGKPAPGLGVLGGSEDRKEDRFGGSEERGSERRKVRRIKRTEGDLHADPMRRRIRGNVFWIVCLWPSSTKMRHESMSKFVYTHIYIYIYVCDAYIA